MLESDQMMAISDQFRLPRNAARGLCRRVHGAVPGLTYAGHRLQILGVRWSREPAGSAIAPHQHSYYEALVILAGAGSETVGRCQALQPGLLQLHAPGTRHGWTAPDAPLLRFAVWFRLDTEVPLRSRPRWPVDERMPAQVGELLAEAGRPAPGARERLQARLLLILSPFLDLLLWPREDELLEAGASLAEAVDLFLQDNIDRPLTLQDLAVMANLSVPTLTRRYRQETGTSIIARYQQLRLDRAGELLRDSELTVREIAARVGYRDPSYFCRRFRGHTGKSPAAYRRGD